MSTTSFSVIVVSLAFVSTAVFGSRITGGDGIVFDFKGIGDKDFCLVSDTHLNINAHVIGVTQHSKSLTWINSLAIMVGNTHILVSALTEASWDPFMDHIQIQVNGSDLHLPAPGHKAGPRAIPGQWQSRTSNLLVTRGRVNEARVQAEGFFDLQLTATPADAELWSDRNCFVHMDMKFRKLRSSRSIHGVLGQTYRPLRLRAARLRKQHNREDSVDVDSAVLGDVQRPAIAGRLSDYVTSGPWAADCKFARYFPSDAGKTDLLRESTIISDGIKITRASSGNRPRKSQIDSAAEVEEVNPLEGYFSDIAVDTVRRVNVDGADAIGLGRLDEVIPPVPKPLVSKEGYVYEVKSAGEASTVDDQDMEVVPEWITTEKIMNE